MNQQQTTTPPHRHAIVIGGSVAGLLTARILTDFFEAVTVIERDRLPDTPAFRKGAPQARHAHALLGRGQQIMEELFPGFKEGLLQNGAVETNMGSEAAFYFGGKRMRLFNSALSGISCSRALIEHQLYSKLRQHPHVHFKQNAAVTEICTNPERTQVTGVRIQNRSQNRSQSGKSAEPMANHLIEANLVIDASGRSSAMPQWLEQLGYEPPNEITVDAKAGYASRLYSRTDFGPDWKLMYYLAEAPTQSRGGIITPIEGSRIEETPAEKSQGEESEEERTKEYDADKRWLVTLVGLNGDHPPTDEAGFLKFARSLPAPELYAALTHAKPISAPYGYQQASNRLRQYDQLPRYLEGLMAIGDAVYALNPVYGQGMTVAALGVKTLQEVLHTQQKRHGLSNLSGMARKFQKQLAKVIDGPWQLATGQDLRWPVAAANHKPSLIERLMQSYFGAVIQTMADDAVVAEAFFYVQNMLKEPTALFHPTIMRRIWRRRQSQRKSVETSSSTKTVGGMI